MPPLAWPDWKSVLSLSALVRVVAARLAWLVASRYTLFSWVAVAGALSVCGWSLWHVLTHERRAAAFAERGLPHVTAVSLNASFVPTTLPRACLKLLATPPVIPSQIVRWQAEQVAPPSLSLAAAKPLPWGWQPVQRPV